MTNLKQLVVIYSFVCIHTTTKGAFVMDFFKKKSIFKKKKNLFYSFGSVCYRFF
jgi:hypothetical protein